MQKCFGSQSRAVNESPSPEVGNTVRDRDAGEAGAVKERIVPDAGDTVANGGAGQCRAVIKSPAPEAGNTVADLDGGRRRCGGRTDAGQLERVGVGDRYETVAVAAAPIAPNRTDIDRIVRRGTYVIVVGPANKPPTLCGGSPS